MSNNELRYPLRYPPNLIKKEARFCPRLFGLLCYAQRFSTVS
jgi:hypothetical protein